MSCNRSYVCRKCGHSLQLVLLGESAVGKSSLVLRFVKGQFHEFQESTIGAAFLTQTLCLDDTTVKFEIWDTAGQGGQLSKNLENTSNFKLFVPNPDLPFLSLFAIICICWAPSCENITQDTIRRFT